MLGFPHRMRTPKQPPSSRAAPGKLGVAPPELGGKHGGAGTACCLRESRQCPADTQPASFGFLSDLHPVRSSLRVNAAPNGFVLSHCKMCFTHRNFWSSNSPGKVNSQPIMPAKTATVSNLIYLSITCKIPYLRRKQIIGRP